MTQRALWPIVLLLATAGILTGHDLSYRLAGVDAGGFHAYLTHAPQLLVAVLVPAVLVSLSTSASAPPPALFALLGAGGFTLMEHVERALHGGVPWLLTTPVFLLGLLLQLPFGLAAWWLARTLSRLSLRRARSPRLVPRFWIGLAAPAGHVSVRLLETQGRSRAPPGLV